MDVWCLELTLPYVVPLLPMPLRPRRCDVEPSCGALQTAQVGGAGRRVPDLYASCLRDVHKHTPHAQVCKLAYVISVPESGPDARLRVGTSGERYARETGEGLEGRDGHSWRVERGRGRGRGSGCMRAEARLRRGVRMGERRRPGGCRGVRCAGSSQEDRPQRGQSRRG